MLISQGVLLYASDWQKLILATLPLSMSYYAFPMAVNGQFSMLASRVNSVQGSTRTNAKLAGKETV